MSQSTPIVNKFKERWGSLGRRNEWLKWTIWGRTVRCARAVPVLCPHCAKRRLFSTAGSHRSQGPEFCTLDAVLNGSYMLL